jgi:hypothetical protein
VVTQRGVGQRPLLPRLGLAAHHLGQVEGDEQPHQAVALLAVDRDLVAAGHQAATCLASV